MSSSEPQWTSKPTKLLDARVLADFRKNKGLTVRDAAALFEVSESALRGYFRDAESSQPSSVNESTFNQIGRVLTQHGVSEELNWNQAEAYASLREYVPGYDGCSQEIGQSFWITEAYIPFIQDRVRGFVGREFIWDAIDEFVAERDSGYILLSGEPGIGKSAIVAKLVQLRKCLFHFISTTIGTTSTKSCHQHLCAQLIARHSLNIERFPDDLSMDGVFLSSLLHQAAVRSTPDNPLFIAIDALDERDFESAAARHNALFLPEVLPDNAFVFATTRETIDSLNLRISSPVLHLEIDHNDASNVDDARSFIEQEISSEGVAAWIDSSGMDPSSFAEELLARSEHNFMYLKLVLAAIAEGDFEGYDVAQLPSKLRGYYRMHWEKMKQDVSQFEENYKPVICTLSVFEHPPTVEEIGQVISMPQDTIWNILQEWCGRRYVHRHVDGAGHERFQIYHRPFRDYLAEEVDKELKTYRCKVVDSLLEKIENPDI